MLLRLLRRMAKQEPDIASHSAGNSECEKREARIEPDIISYSAGIRACEKGKTCEKREATAEPGITSHSGGGTSRAMWKARAVIAAAWLAGGKPFPRRPPRKPGVINYSAESNAYRRQFEKELEEELGKSKKSGRVRRKCEKLPPSAAHPGEPAEKAGKPRGAARGRARARGAVTPVGP